MATVATAMLDYPEFVEGPGRSNTVIMEQLDVIAKLGAEGVLGLGTTNGYSVAVKTLDGSGRINALVGLNLLIAVGAIDPERARPVIEDATPSITGAEAVVGGFELAPAVVDVLRAIAADREVPVAAVALAWVLDRPSVASAIIGFDRGGETLRVDRRGGHRPGRDGFELARQRAVILIQLLQQIRRDGQAIATGQRLDLPGECLGSKLLLRDHPRAARPR